ncbi:hypothetical protein [Sporosarcina ureae]|uniref:hypothetical protein n=1 Tax=Sporosarcina ureae TaxID=1571 RepID=UPI0026EAC294|nr:hypothetical protein [Sporosarcina ureae]
MKSEKSIGRGRGNSFFDFIGMLILALYCMNFLNKGIYIPLAIFPIILICLFALKYNPEFTLTLLTLTGFCVVYAVVHYFYHFSSKGIIIMYLTYPITLYVLGYIVTRGESKKMYQYLVVIIVSFTLVGFLSLMNTVSIYGDMTNAIQAFGGRRLVMNIWDNSLISATGINTSLSFGLAMLPIIFLKDKGNKKSNIVRVIAFLSFLASTYCVIQLGNRTGLGIIILSILVAFFLIHNNGKKILVISTSVTIFFIMKIGFDKDILGIRSAWETTLLYARLESAELGSDSRITTWLDTLNGLVVNPMGGKETSISITYAHNLWLDVAFEGGIFPFALLIIFTIISIISLVQFQKYKHPLILQGLVLTIITAFFITFMVEPIIQGWFTYFNIFCFIVGMMQRNNLGYRRNITNDKFIEAYPVKWL